MSGKYWFFQENSDTFQFSFIPRSKTSFGTTVFAFSSQEKINFSLIISNWSNSQNIFKKIYKLSNISFSKTHNGSAVSYTLLHRENFSLWKENRLSITTIHFLNSRLPKRNTIEIEFLRNSLQNRKLGKIKIRKFTMMSLRIKITQLSLFKFFPAISTSWK